MNTRDENQLNEIAALLHKHIDLAKRDGAGSVAETLEDMAEMLEGHNMRQCGACGLYCHKHQIYDSGDYFACRACYEDEQEREAARCQAWQDYRDECARDLNR